MYGNILNAPKADDQIVNIKPCYISRYEIWG